MKVSFVFTQFTPENLSVELGASLFYLVLLGFDMKLWETSLTLDR